MSVQIRTDLPLEKRLKEVASSASNDFPDRNVAYWPRYETIKGWIAAEYYQSAGTGLALHGERYTRHDISHVDDVIDMAGRLLGYDSGDTNALFYTLRPYEVYVLLFSILLHDAGNAQGREAHEKQPKAIIAATNSILRQHVTETKLIASIAEAHGGRAPDGGKDTISKIVSDEEIKIGPIGVRARLLAAVLRLADELSENHHRADPQALKQPYNPPQSAIHNLYCTIIDPKVDYKSRTIYLNFSIPKDRLAEEFVLKPKSRKKILLVDYISERVEKCDLERRYCNRFMYPVIYDRIRVTLEIFDDDEYTVLEKISLELADEGYPNSPKALKFIDPRFDGQSLRLRYGHPVAELVK